MFEAGKAVPVLFVVVEELLEVAEEPDDKVEPVAFRLVVDCTPDDGEELAELLADEVVEELELEEEVVSVVSCTSELELELDEVVEDPDGMVMATPASWHMDFK